MTTINQKKAALENILSNVAGFECELTIRSVSKFTLSAEGLKDFSKVIEWLNATPTKRASEISTDFDSECDLTCLYFTLN